MAKKSYQERVRERREQDILKTASRLIHQQGYSNFSMDGLADAVGISKSTLYQHFNSKEDMVLQVLLKGFTLLETHMDASEGDPLTRLEALLRHLLTTAYAPDGFATTLVKDEIMALFQHHEVVGQHMGQSYARLNEWVNLGKAQGQIRDDLANSIIISTMFSMIHVLDAPQNFGEDLSAEAIVEQAVSLWRRGIMPDTPRAP